MIGFLINKEYRKHLLTERRFEKFFDQDTLDILWLLSPYISGFFDVDRLDYLERDSTMAGVSYGLVETNRILTCVRTILVESKDNELSAEIVIRAKRLHMLDHFLVCLYEMYTQLYNHPTNLQIQYEVKTLVGSFSAEIAKDVGLDWHRRASDEDFLNLIRKHDQGLLNDIIFRQFKKSGETIVTQVYSKSSTEYQKRIDEGWAPLPTHKRQLLKDGSQVWLIDAFVRGSDQPQIFGWAADSLVASRLSGAAYEPVVLWRNKKFLSRINELKEELLGLQNEKRMGKG